jgi:hypothetical protein
MRQFALYPQICSEVPVALALINTQKYEAVIVDLLLGQFAQAVLEEVRTSRSNRTAVLFTISGSVEGSAEAFKAGSSFVLERPLSETSVNRTLKAAYGLIVRERRRYFRCPVAVPANIQAPAMDIFSCQIINISEGGMAMTTPIPLKARDLVEVRFALPDRHFKFEIDSHVCWSDGKTRMGLQFAFAADKQDKSELQDWLAHKLEESLPESVAEKFRWTTHS